MIANFLLAGQSNINQWFHVDGGATLDEFKAAFLRQNPQYSDVAFYDAARGGSAILAASALQHADYRASDDPVLHEAIQQNYWFDEETGTAGPDLQYFEQQILGWIDDGIEFQGIVWAQGEADTTFVNEENADDYAAGLSFVLDELMRVSNADAVYIQALGDRAFYSESLHAGTEIIRQIQADLADQNLNITLSSTIFDLELRDSVHLTDEAYLIAAERIAVAISTGETSPQISHISVSDTGDILIQIDLGKGQTLDDITSAAGFKIMENGGEVAIQSIQVSADGLVRLTPSTPVTAPTVSYGASDVAIGMGVTDYLTATGDLLTLPIQPFSLPVGLSVVNAHGSGFDLQGTQQDDLLLGFSTDDYLIGGAGDDVLIAGSGQDRLYGGEGEDTFVMSSLAKGFDIVYDFEIGVDKIGLNGFSFDQLQFSIYNGTDLDICGPDGLRMVLRNVSLADISSVDFTQIGTNKADHLTGGDGWDNMHGSSGDDLLDSGAGTDRLYGGAGADSYVFGAGYDLNIIYDFDLNDDTIVLDGIDLSDLSVRVYNGVDLEIYLSGEDRMVLRNIALADFSAIQFEIAKVESGFVFEGGAGADIITGLENDDLLRGNGGNDRLYGGGGDDVFVFQPAGELDIVYDFEDGADLILFEGGNYSDLTFSVYNGTDVEITSDTGGRMVLRDTDISLLSEEDFVFVVPDAFLV